MKQAGLRALLCLLLSLALVASACTGDGAAPGDNGTPTIPEEGAENDVTPPDSQQTSQIFEPTDDVLNVAISPPATLDPMRIQDPGSVLVARQLYEGLTRWDPVEEKVVPAAAESWRVADGGRTFIFKLRDGMTFHDGSPVTAKDFVYAFDRIALKENASDLAYTLERVAGFTEVNQLGRSRHLSGLLAQTPSILVIRLDEPFYDLPAVLTHPALVPLSRSRVERIDEFLAAPVGNGPFKMAEVWAPEQPVILEAFPGFIETPDLDGIRFLPFPDAAASWLQFRDAGLDVAEVPAGQIENATELYGDQGFKPFLASYYYAFNLRSKGLNDIRLRRAVNRAIDRDEIATTVYNGTLSPARGIVPEGMPGFQENICLRICRYAPEEARSLVRRLKKEDRRLTLDFTKGDPHDEVARMVQEDLEEAGFRVTIRGFGFSRFLRRLRDGDQAIYRLGWIAEYPTPDVFLTALFGTDSPDNHTGFSSGRVDQLLAQARSERSDSRRLQLYIQAEKAILAQEPVVPIGSFVTHWAAQERVKDLYFDVMGGFDAVNVFVEPAQIED